MSLFLCQQGLEKYREKMGLKKLVFILVCFLGFSIFLENGPVLSEDLPARVKKSVNESITIRQKTQKSSDKWAEERPKLKAKYETLETENGRLKAVNDGLKKDLAARRASIDALEREIAEISRISEELIPFLEQTYDRLAEWVREDVPFLADEREKRLETLRRILDDPLVHAGEKFRKVMEALSVEAEYGNTVEAYGEEIIVGERKIQVNIFRLGRISLFFQSLDGEKTGYFDPSGFVWKEFPPQQNRHINAAMEMATKQRPVDLLILPLGKLVTK
jgi:archaellum component FlaC